MHKRDNFKPEKWKTFIITTAFTFEWQLNIKTHQAFSHLERSWHFFHIVYSQTLKARVRGWPRLPFSEMLISYLQPLTNCSMNNKPDSSTFTEFKRWLCQTNRQILADVCYIWNIWSYQKRPGVILVSLNTAYLIKWW